MHPTFKQVPPRAPLFSMHATYDPLSNRSTLHLDPKYYLHTLLAGFDSSDITCDAASNNDQVVLG